MTYIATDASVQGGNPALLFDFAQGATNWRFCNLAEDVVYLSNTYTASSISMGQVEQSGKLQKAALNLVVPRTNTLATALLTDPSDAPITVTVFRGHLDDGEFITYWKGRIVNNTSTNDEVNIECEPIFTSLRRPGLRARYQKTCRHALYQRGCNLTDTDFADAASVIAISKLSVTLATDPSASAGYYIGGMIEYAGVKRYIANHAGTAITLMRSFSDLETEVAANGATAATLYPGCDHTKATCIAKFNNLVNYGGFPFIPRKNPMGGQSIT